MIRAPLWTLALLLASLGAAAGARAEPPPCTVEAGEQTATVDLNAADERALLALPGIGPARARAILDYRSVHGPFRSVSQLLQIKGIGRALLKQLRPYLTLASPPG